MSACAAMRTLPGSAALALLLALLAPSVAAAVEELDDDERVDLEEAVLRAPLPLGELYEQVRPAVVRVHTRDASGSGFLVAPDRVVTAWHVVSRGGDIVLETADRRQIKATVRAFDRKADVALLTLEEPLGDVRPLTVVREAPAVGDPLLTVGHPLVSGKPPRGDRAGLLEWSLTGGAVAAVGEKQLQVTTSFQPGNSGGPALDGRGRAVGVVIQRMGDFGVATRPEPLVALMDLAEPDPSRPRVRARLAVEAGLDLLPAVEQRRSLLGGLGGGVDVTVARRFLATLRGRVSFLTSRELRQRGQRGRRWGLVAGVGGNLELPFDPHGPRLPSLRPLVFGGLVVVQRGERVDTIRYLDPGCDPTVEACPYDADRSTSWEGRTLPWLGAGLRVGTDVFAFELELGTSPVEALEQLTVRVGMSIGVPVP